MTEFFNALQPVETDDGFTESGSTEVFSLKGNLSSVLLTRTD